MQPVEFRLPAEWEPQAALLLAWPFAGGDWTPVLEGVHDEYAALIEAVLEYQNVLLLVQPGDRSASARLGRRPGLHYLKIPYNDTWCRDFGPVTLCNAGQRLALDFYFNGWGGRHEARLDNRVNTHLARHRLFSGFNFRQSLFELEGGAIDCDGRGTLLVNRHWTRARHPYLEDSEADEELRRWLNAETVHTIDLPPLPGDETDGHIDTMARFADPGTIVFQSLADDPSTRRLASGLELLRTPDGVGYELIALPAPSDLDPGLAASYANFILINGAVLVPSFGSRADDEARRIFSRQYPERHVIQVDARNLVSQGGGPHCASMQIPAALA